MSVPEAVIEVEPPPAVEPEPEWEVIPPELESQHRAELGEALCSSPWVRAVFVQCCREWRHYRNRYPPGGANTRMRLCPGCSRVCPPHEPDSNQCGDCEAWESWERFRKTLKDVPEGPSLADWRHFESALGADRWRTWQQVGAAWKSVCGEEGRRQYRVRYWRPGVESHYEVLTDNIRKGDVGIVGPDGESAGSVAYDDGYAPKRKLASQRYRVAVNIAFWRLKRYAGKVLALLPESRDVLNNEIKGYLKEGRLQERVWRAQYEDCFKEYKYNRRRRRQEEEIDLGVARPGVREPFVATVSPGGFGVCPRCDEWHALVDRGSRQRLRFTCEECRVRRRRTWTCEGGATAALLLGYSYDRGQDACNELGERDADASYVENWSNRAPPPAGASIALADAWFERQEPLPDDTAHHEHPTDLPEELLKESQPPEP